MLKLRFTTLTAVALLTVSTAPAMADTGMGTPHHLVAGQPYLKYLSNEQKLELHNYLNYETREPCQHYRTPPAGFYKDGCDLKYRYPQAEPAPKMVQQRAEPVAAPSTVLTSYEVHFAFDSASIDADASRILDQVASEIARYEPREVVVAGHADRAGPSNYNVTLSQKRAQAVSDALTGRGVPNRVLDEKAYGESDPAVPTGDGVALEENRRVVIEFRK